MTVIEVAEKRGNGEWLFAVCWKEGGCSLLNPTVVKDHT
jgi:hypothetical protein